MGHLRVGGHEVVCVGPSSVGDSWSATANHWGTLRVAETKDQLQMRPFFKVILFVLVAGWLFGTVMFVCVTLFEQH